VRLLLLLLFFFSAVVVYADSPIPTPDFPDFTDYFSLQNFIRFWTSSTYGLFPHVLSGLAVAAVYLKTRSIGLAVIATMVILLASPMISWLSIFIALGLSYLLYRALYKKE